jgi:type IV secretory pathway VirD2 relaxase
MDDDAFVPRLGRMRAGGGRKARRYLSRVVAAAARAATGSKRRGARFDGSRIGRGASIGRLVGSRTPGARSLQRRAIVKTRLVRLGAKGAPAARAHLRYLQRDGTTRDGAPGQLYSAGSDEADGRAFLERGQDDRHQFRFIVAAEDGDQYPDLKPLTRRLMAQMENDLGTKLDWVAVDHFNTGHPHTHIILRGIDDRGRNLVIAREYIAHGMRARAGELVSLDLGPRTPQEIDAQRHREVEAERLTGIDRRLVRAMDAPRLVAIADRDPVSQSLKAGRLRTLSRLGLARPVGRSHWQLAEGLEKRLRDLGERGDIIRTMQRALSHRELARDWRAADPDSSSEPVVGRVIACGLADEHRDRHYLVVEGIDGQAHYFDIGRGDVTPSFSAGAIVAVSPVHGGVRGSDRAIAAIAAAGDGTYSVEMHLAHDQTASLSFAEAHVRRLEGLRRAGVSLTRHDDGIWSIPADYLRQVERVEAARRRAAPFVVEILSPMPVDALVEAEAATWLDRTLADGRSSDVRDTGFGRDVRAALEVRGRWLVGEGLAEVRDGRVKLQDDALSRLAARETLRVAQGLAAELGKTWSRAATGERLEGRVTRRVQMLSGAHALIERSHDFTLVPWRPALERGLGREVSGIVRTGGISWSFGRGRGGIEPS